MRILFVTSTRIGDAVLSTGVLAHLHELYPSAEFWVACGVPAAPLFAETPFVTRILPMKKEPWAGHWVKLWLATCGRFWDVIVDLRGSGLAYALLGWRRVVAGPADPNEHRLQHLARVMGEVAPLPPRLWTSEATRARMAAMVAGRKPLLVLGPTANWIGKAWPPERFAELARRLTARTGALPAATIAILCAPNERAAAAPVIEALPPAQVLDLTGTIGLLEAHALLAHADLYVGNDSGLMHLAAAAGAPTLGLFGPSPDINYSPFGPRAAFVRGPRSFREIVSDPAFNHLSADRYMLDLAVDAVHAAAERLLARPRVGEPVAAEGGAA
ncbi:MAG: glycosyltransferase family 9 protein [Alphaproteobacteria bacterium]|nr:glycosyltransferase family 9 protein [Alphaproteobacteria bacterium]